VPSSSNSPPSRASVSESAPPATSSRPPAATTASPQPVARTTAETSDLSYDDLYQAIIDAAYEEQTKQEVEAFYTALVGELRRRQQEQGRAQEEAEARALLQRIARAQEVQRQRENYKTLAQLGLLQTFLNSAMNR
jgi:hypothetical protein